MRCRTVEGGVGRELFGEHDDRLVVGRFEFAESVRSIFEVLERGALVVSAGSLSGEEEEAFAEGGMDFFEEGNSTVEVKPGVGPGGLRELGGEGDEREAVLVFEASEHLGGVGEAG